MNDFKPFENDTQSITIGEGNGVTFENGKDSITVYGDLEIHKDTNPNDIQGIIELLTEIKNTISIKNKKPLNI